MISGQTLRYRIISVRFYTDHQTVAGRPGTLPLAVRRSLPALPVSAVGLDDPACRGAEGGQLQYQFVSVHCIKTTETGKNEVKTALNTDFLHKPCGFLEYPAALSKCSAHHTQRIEPADGPPQRRSRCSSQLPLPFSFQGLPAPVKLCIDANQQACNVRIAERAAR